MTITRISRSDVERSVHKAVEAIRGGNYEDLRAELTAMVQVIREEGAASGYVIHAGEDEIDPLLTPYIRMLGREHVMLSITVVGGAVSVAALNKLRVVERNSARSVMVPLPAAREQIFVVLLPLSRQLQALLAEDGLAACVFRKRDKPENR